MGVAGGMNGSVIYELDRPENKGLKTPFKACFSISESFISLLLVSLEFSSS